MTNGTDCVEGNTAGDQVTVKGCSGTQYCMNTISWTNITQNAGQHSACNDTPAMTPSKSRYPGEACDTNNLCFTGTCTSGTCPGNTAACNSTADCSVGYACFNLTNGVNGTCSKQVAAGGACDDFTQCPNTQTCNSKVCVDYYSLALGTVNITDAQSCMSGFSNAKSICDHQKIGYGKNDANMTVDTASNLLICSPSQTCNYLQSDNTTNTPVQCACGYTPTGKSYCPMLYDEKNAAWIGYINTEKAQYANTCHSSRRSYCFEQMTASQFSTAANARMNTVTAHQFVASPGCVKSMFGASSRLSLGLGLISALFAYIMF